MNNSSRQSFTYLIEGNSFAGIGGVSDLIYEIKNSDISINDLILSDRAQSQILQMLAEHKNRDRISAFNGLKPVHKIILEGDSGCGKTTTALAIAHELGKSIIIVNLSEIISSRLGETSKNFNKVIKYANENNAIIFFDEFDSVSRHRNDDKELGEIKRLVNSLIQLLDFCPDGIIIIGATNNVKSIDGAILRRFEETIEFKKPEKHQIHNYLGMMEFYFSGKVSINRSDGMLQLLEGHDYFRIRTIINNAVKKKAINSSSAEIKISSKDLNI